MFEIYYITKYFFSKYCFQRTRRRRTYMKWVSWASCGINWSKKWYFDDWCLVWPMLSKRFYWMYENVHHILAIRRNSWCRIIVLLLHVFLENADDDSDERRGFQLTWSEFSDTDISWTVVKLNGFRLLLFLRWIWGWLRRNG